MDIKKSRVFRFRYWPQIGATSLLLSVAILMSIYGTYVIDNLENWKAWRAESYKYFLVWRLMLYAIAIRFWFPFRKRLVQREPDVRWRLIRAEILVTTTCVVIEISRAQTLGIWGPA